MLVVVRGPDLCADRAGGAAPYDRRVAGPGTDSEVPVGEALRSGPTGLATQMCHDCRAVDVEALGELGDRRTDGARLDELFYPWRAEAGLLLPHAVATAGGLPPPSARSREAATL